MIRNTSRIIKRTHIDIPSCTYHNKKDKGSLIFFNMGSEIRVESSIIKKNRINKQKTSVHSTDKLTDYCLESILWQLRP